jgi:hypothetical protein
MCHDPEEAAEYQVGDAEGLVATQLITEPAVVLVVPRRTLLVGVDQDVHITEDHVERR